MIISLYRGTDITGEICLTKEEYEHLLTKKAIQIFRPWQLSRRDRTRALIRGYAVFNNYNQLIGLRLDEAKIERPAIIRTFDRACPNGEYTHINCRCVIGKPQKKNGNGWGDLWR